MLLRRFLFLFLVFCSLSVAAQDAEYPTLLELADLEVPGYDYADMVRRISAIDISHTPPSSAPEYQIGDSKVFMAPIDDTFYEDGPVTMVLRGMSDNVLVWIDEKERLSASRTQWLAEEIDRTIVEPMLQLFGFSEPPGIDGDPRLYLVGVRQPDSDIAGIFAKSHTLPRSVYGESNEREMIVLNLSNNDKSDVFDPYFISTIAHEYQHVLMHFRDPDEVRWVDEALSTAIEHQLFGFEYIAYFAEEFLKVPHTGLTQFNLGGDVYPRYGAAALFFVFLAEQYGSEILRHLQAEPADGWQGVDKVLREHYSVSADEAFANWALANYFLDYERGYGYQSMDSSPTPPPVSATIRTSPSLQTSAIPQYSTDYYAVDVRGAGQLKLQLTQSPEANLITDATDEGEFFYYAVATGTSDNRLTRQIDLRKAVRPVLYFNVWFDLAPHQEHAYVLVSEDGGVNWDILRGNYTTRKSEGGFYDNAYTGSSDDWREERINLLSYRGKSILLRFELFADFETTFRGMAIDNLRIAEIDYNDSFESPDSNWIAEGWIRTDNRLPQRTWVQVVQEGPEELILNRFMQTASGEMTIDLQPGVDRVLVAVSPVVPVTSLDSQYSLQFTLIDEAGALMRISRDCTVTTTHGLNFRDGPNGNKIGLVPVGTAVTALDRRGDWFQVEYGDTRGWISASYVTMKGNCDM